MGAWTVILGNAAVGLWALAAHRLPALRTPWLWRATALAEVAVLAQVVLGVALLARDHDPADRFHEFYGFVALLSVGGIYSYRHQLRHRLFLLYGLGGLFVMGLGLRALYLSGL